MDPVNPVTATDIAQVAVTPDRGLQLGSFARVAQRLAAAKSETDLCDAVEVAMRGLFRVGQVELFTRDRGGSFVPVVRLGAGRLGAGLKLLSVLKGRKTLRQDDGRLDSPHIFPKLRGVGRGSLMAAPLIDGGDLIGLIIVEATVAAPDFAALDLEILGGVAGICSLALQRLRSKELRRAQARVDGDLKNARRVQRELMPTSLPASAGVIAVAEYLPSLDVGGDFYDFVELGAGVVGAVVGDVSGKGVAAALVMSRVSSEFRRFHDGTRTPAQVLAAVNRSMVTEFGETFTTALCLAIDSRAGVLTVASAGHVPLIVRRAGGEVFTFGSASGTPLGMLPSEYANESLELNRGDIVLAMTDGLVEALDRPSDRMGTHLLLGLIKYAPHDPHAIIARSLEAVEKMKGQKSLDDVTVVALQPRP
jgi:sigma-B regulation protein RsbU (phosphoserine phosphatase)